jgi:hypothetical protein
VPERCWSSSLMDRLVVELHKNCPTKKRLAARRARGIQPADPDALTAGALRLLWTPRRTARGDFEYDAAFAAGLYGSSGTGSKSDRRARGTRRHPDFSDPVISTVAPYSSSTARRPLNDLWCGQSTLTPSEPCNPASWSARPRRCALFCRL